MLIVLGAIVTTISAVMYSNNSTNLCDISGLIVAPTTETAEITTMEQIEEKMQKIDPVKAERWRKFLESDGQPPVQKQVAQQEAPPSGSSKTIQEIEDDRAAINSKQVREWRSKFNDAAALTDEEAHRREAKKYAEHAYQIANLRKCKYVFLDFGSNVGDSLLKVIDSFIPEFDSGIENGKKIHHIVNTTTGNIGPGVYDHFKRNLNKWILPKWVKQKVEDYNSFSKKKHKSDPVYPEDYCFYGVEGNPHFTPWLRREEIQVMNMIPRPIRHAHFLTDHVGAGKDGPTTLYLDTVNKKDNFWGSSIIASHVDVVASGGNTGTPVTGITLTSLIEQTVAPGGHVMIKIDIEGGEYPLLEEAINSKILCKLTKDMGVKVDMLNERHNAKVVGSEEPGERWKAIDGDNAIKRCGVGYGWGRNFR